MHIYQFEEHRTRILHLGHFTSVYIISITSINLTFCHIIFANWSIATISSTFTQFCHRTYTKLRPHRQILTPKFASIICTNIHQPHFQENQNMVDSQQ